MSGLRPHLDPEQPLIGLFSGSRQVPNTDDMMDRIARYYAAKLLELYPDGGFALGGNCQGARVAHRIARILTDEGRPPDRLCFLEYFDTALFEYPGKLMLMYGKHSKHKAYRPIRWGRAGWQDRFRTRPVVAFVTGRHGRFFRPQNAGEIANNIACFLDDRPLPERPFGKARAAALMATHRIWPLFALYTLEYKVRTFLVHGSQRGRSRRERKRQRIQILKQRG